jgi:hypothetical protein
MPQHRYLRGPQLRSWLDSQLVREPGPDRGVHVEGFGLPAGDGEGTHEQGVWTLPERMLTDQLQQLRHQAGGTARQAGRGPQLAGGQPQLLQPPSLHLNEPRAGEVLQHRATPQRQRLVQRHRRTGRVARRQRLSAAGDEALEVGEIDRPSRDAEQVTRRSGHQYLIRQ